MLTLEERQVWETRTFLYCFTQKVKNTHFHTTCLLTLSVVCPLSSIFKTFKRFQGSLLSNLFKVLHTVLTNWHAFFANKHPRPSDQAVDEITKYPLRTIGIPFACAHVSWYEKYSPELFPLIWISLLFQFSGSETSLQETKVRFWSKCFRDWATIDWWLRNWRKNSDLTASQTYLVSTLLHAAKLTAWSRTPKNLSFLYF